MCETTADRKDFEFAEHCLRHFGSEFSDLYGVHHLTYNLHSLIHLARDCITQQQCLDKFSAFRYESYLGRLKRLVTGPNNPLAKLNARLQKLINYNSMGLQININRHHNYCLLTRNKKRTHIASIKRGMFIK